MGQVCSIGGQFSWIRIIETQEKTGAPTKEVKTIPNKSRTQTRNRGFPQVPPPNQKRSVKNPTENQLIREYLNLFAKQTLWKNTIQSLQPFSPRPDSRRSVSCCSWPTKRCRTFPTEDLPSPRSAVVMGQRSATASMGCSQSTTCAFLCNTLSVSLSCLYSDVVLFS